MTYRILETDKSLGHALRRIGEDQLEAAIDDTRRPLDDADAAVHDIRKHCKKLRGLFRLVRPGFPDYAEENAAVRDAARMTSSLRDAGVLLKTFDALLIDTDPAPFDGLRATLAAETGRSLSEAELSAAFEQQRKALKAIRKRAHHWKIQGNSDKVLLKGLSKTWRRAARGFDQAAQSKDPESFHEFRKRTKDHWYHSRLLQGFWPGPIRSHRDQVRTLSERLGEYQDLSVFLERLDGPDLPVSSDQMRLIALRRRRQIGDDALALASKVFVGDIDGLPRSWQRRWKPWAKSA